MEFVIGDSKAVPARQKNNGSWGVKDKNRGREGREGKGLRLTKWEETERGERYLRERGERYLRERD